MDPDRRSSVTPEDFHSIISISIDGFLLVSLEGNIIEANDSYCQMIGYVPHQRFRQFLQVAQSL
ncbi:MAG: PAS domain-containing protein [Desulfuromonadaceae bacterium]